MPLEDKSHFIPAPRIKEYFENTFFENILRCKPSVSDQCGGVQAGSRVGALRLHPGQSARREKVPEPADDWPGQTPRTQRHPAQSSGPEYSGPEYSGPECRERVVGQSAPPHPQLVHRGTVQSRGPKYTCR
jgi:hypothetical protein